MSKRVVMFLTNDAVSDPRVEKEARALVGAGFEVTVLAWDRAGKAAPVEERDGFTIERLGPRAPYGGGVKSLPLFREFWRTAADRAAEIGPDIVHCHDMDTAPAGIRAVKRATGERPKLVLDMHELYRDSKMVPQRGAVGAVARTVVRILERRAFPAADVILVANPGTLGYYESLGAGDKVVLVENAPDTRLFAPSEQRPERPFTVGYFGQKRYLEGLLALVAAIRVHPDMAAILAGGGTAADEIARASADVDRIEVSGRFDYADLPALYTRCDAVYAVYGAVLGNVRTLFPVKVMEAMACALPVVVSTGTWIGEYVEREGIGLAIDGDDPVALSEALVRLKDEPKIAEEMGKRGLAIVQAGLSWQAASARLVHAYEALDTRK